MKLTPIETNVLREALGIGAGRTAAALSDLTGASIEISIPSVNIVELDAFMEDVRLLAPGASASVLQDFEGRFNGRAILAFRKQDGGLLAHLMGGGDFSSDEADLELSGVLTEVGNIVLNGVLSSLVRMTREPHDYTVPECSLNDSLRGLLRLPPAGNEPARRVVAADACIVVGGQAIEGALLIVFESAAIEAVLEALSLTTTEA